MSHFLVNNVATLPIIFQQINGGTSTTTKMLEETDDLGSLYESFNSSNTTTITNLYNPYKNDGWNARFKRFISSNI